MRAQPLAALLAAAALLITGCTHQPVVEARWRFIGADALAAQTNAPDLARMFTIPEAKVVRSQLVTNLAREWWRFASPATPAPSAALADARSLEPGLLDRLTLGQTWRLPDGRGGAAVALQLDSAASASWSAAWSRFWTIAQPGAKPEAKTISGWLVAVSDTALASSADALKQLSTIPAEPGDALRYEGPGPDGSRVVSTTALRHGQAHTVATVTTPGRLPAVLPDWDLPEMIHNPFMQFSAVRGIGGWLKTQPFFSGLDSAAIPDQGVLWARGQPPGQQPTTNMDAVMSYASVRVGDSAAFVRELQKSLTAAAADPANKDRLGYQIAGATNGAGFKIRGFPPFVDPKVVTNRIRDREFATFGLFPIPRVTNDIPAGLIKELSQTNLLYYGWEITGAALGHFNLAAQLWEMAHLKAAMVGPASRWAKAAALGQGNLVTEVKIAGEHELRVTRDGPGALSALELVAVAHWLDWDQLRQRKASPAPGAALPSAPGR